MDKLIFDFLDLKDKILPNKIVRNVGITWMEETLVPQEYLMEVTSVNQDLISYCK